MDLCRLIRRSVPRLRFDRADVVIPAVEIYLPVMKWRKIKRMFVPQIGVSDGIIYILYERQRCLQPTWGNGDKS